jgi:hypothetical protein
MFDIHPPRYWVFGHFHRDWTYADGGTTFVCVGEFCNVDVDVQGDPTAPLPTDFCPNFVVVRTPKSATAIDGARVRGMRCR